MFFFSFIFTKLTIKNFIFAKKKKKKMKERKDFFISLPSESSGGTMNGMRVLS